MREAPSRHALVRDIQRRNLERWICLCPVLSATSVCRALSHRGAPVLGNDSPDPSLLRSDARGPMVCQAQQRRGSDGRGYWFQSRPMARQATSPHGLNTALLGAHLAHISTGHGGKPGVGAGIQNAYFAGISCHLVPNATRLSPPWTASLSRMVASRLSHPDGLARREVRRAVIAMIEHIVIACGRAQSETLG